VIVNEIVTYPSGKAGRQAVADDMEWTEGSVVELINGVAGGEAGGISETRPFIMKALTVESISLSAICEMVFYAGDPGSEEEIFRKRFASGQYPFELPIFLKRTFLGGTRIIAKIMASLGSTVVFFSIQYEADPGNVHA